MTAPLFETEEARKEREHEKDLAKIEAKKASFIASPFWYTACEFLSNLVLLLILLAIAQCTCGGCIWKP